MANQQTDNLLNEMNSLFDAPPAPVKAPAPAKGYEFKYNDAVQEIDAVFSVKIDYTTYKLGSFGDIIGVVGYEKSRKSTALGAIISAGIGRKKILTEKLRHSGVQVSYNWLVGPSFGFTKPIYLEIVYIDEPNNQPYLEVEKFNPDLHYIDNIYGRASSLRGFDELAFQPGAFGKLSFTFEYSNERERLKGIEAGAAADFFSRRIPIMASYDNESMNPKNHQLFLSLFLTLFIGTKYDQK